MQSSLFFLCSPHSVLPSASLHSYRRLFRFGGQVTVTNVVNYVSGSIDVLVVGKLLGMEILGFYTRAFLLARSTADSFLMALVTVMFPAYSRIQGQMDRIGRTYVVQVQIMSMITMPLFATLRKH